MQGVKQDLARDIESYACGEEPSEMEILRAARIDEWTALVRQRGKEFILIVEGIVTGHPEINDSAIGRSGAIVWFDRHHRWARSHRRLWVLGHHAGEEIPLDGIVTDDEG
ncbi:hypothetical protein BF49_5594 [Bradyrhizobium sp.]|uniref:hypothetical protein n=1 Tax=Bradyrhizobium sp. TaxID=376 RepID=UPI0007C1E691|nr:hypothetical protein [Bradyrhizobium sp.]CUT14514.1 hypothetical protein BF49_5594 [Bradyrhizobium sp.]